jgi:hypothetical protein
MALAMIYPEPKRGVHSELRGATGDVSATRLSRARTVLGFGRDDLAPAVRSVKAFAPVFLRF